MNEAGPRYLPTRSFPRYAFLPGRDPHPQRDPEGHSFGHEWPPELIDAAEWASSESYLFGVDLFNHGYFWEAHEAWESLWMGAKDEDPVQGRFLQGLIQCAAARLKERMEQPTGIAKLTETGTALVASAAGEAATYMGIEVAAFVEAMRQYAKEPERAPQPRIVLGL